VLPVGNVCGRQMHGTRTHPVFSSPLRRARSLRSNWGWHELSSPGGPPWRCRGSLPTFLAVPIDCGASRRVAARPEQAGARAIVSRITSEGWRESRREDFADVAGQRRAKGILEAVVAGRHNVVTYFTNATDLGTQLRGVALRSGWPGGGRRTGVIAMLAGLFSPSFCRTQESLWGLAVTSGQPRGPNDARASMRPPSIGRSTRKTSAANFAQTAF
jgi:hypothetical protein